MTILVVGATGANRRLLVEQLFNRGHNVKVIVRSPDKCRVILKNHDCLSVIHEGVLEFSDAEKALQISLSM